MYKYISRNWRSLWRDQGRKEDYVGRKILLRRESTILRSENPLRLDKAKRVGYRAKQGYVVVRGKVSRGGIHKIAPKMGRRQKRTGITKIKRGKSMKQIAEERVQKRYPNLKVLGSYFIAKDGKHKWYEIILKDPCL